MSWVIAIPLSLLVATLAACTPQDGGGAGEADLETRAGDVASSEPQDVLARVNGMIVATDEFQKEAQRRARGRALPLEERQKILDEIVARKLLYQAALEARLDRDPRAQSFLARLMFEREINAKLPKNFPDAEVRSYYEAHREEFAIPEGVRVRRILIRTKPDRPEDEAKTLAERVREELVEDPDAFERLATEHSGDPNLPRGAASHFIRPNEPDWIDRAVVDRAFSLQVGELSPVFRTEQGFNIITTIDRRERVERSYEQAKSSVLRKLRYERRKALSESYLEELRSQASIEVDEAKLGSIEIAVPQAHR